MPLGDLIDFVENLRLRVEEHQILLQQSEALTRYVLIDPLLRLLGWDTEDPNKVRPEYPNASGRPDYALCLNGKPVAMLEAKSLGTALNEDIVRRAMEYCTTQGVQYAIVTNGDRWEAYDLSVFHATPDQRRKCEFSVKADASHSCALSALYLWRPNLSSGNAIAPAEPTFLGAMEPTMIGPSDGPVMTLDQANISSHTNEASPLVSADWVKLSDWNPPTKTPAPTVMRFPDGTESSVQKWKNLLVVAGDWLNATGKLASVSKPILNGAKERVLDSDNSGFISPTPVSGTNFWLNTHGNAGNLRQKTRAILIHCGIDPATVHLQVEQ